MDRPQKPGRLVGGQLGRGASWQKMPQQRMELVDGADPGLSQVDAPFALAPAAPTDATVCKGDAGGPVWRTENGKPALAGVVSRSWQGGCLGTPAGETRTGAYATRSDDVVGWVQDVRSRTIEIKPGTHLFAIGSEGSTYGLDVNYTTGVWGTGWTRPDDTRASRPSPAPSPATPHTSTPSTRTPSCTPATPTTTSAGATGTPAEERISAPSVQQLLVILVRQASVAP
ncbi:hypothetical protein [Kitasatospora cineracea]|uniref:hypothetical protein n=1 Tax=Kitasatospora cineracea TaxID=88074 RepID=UPI003798CF07